MVFCQMFILLWILFPKTIVGDICPRKCKCTNAAVSALRVDCSLQDLKELPFIPASTKELYLQQNQIVVIPPGAFDNLMDLRKLNLSSNPLHCDCKIWYLKMWLDDQRLDEHSSPICFIPAGLHGTPVSHLTTAHIAPCSRPQTLCSDFLFKDTFIYASLFLLFFLMVLCLKTIKLMKFKLKVTDNDIKFHRHQSLRIGLLKRRFNRFDKTT